ncbi:MAG: ATP-binding cassette domain-containing protein [Anaerolineae bacterium]|nr:ATP-binding cassette domain-containing protein [Anaerolineae bacterium]
MSTREIVAEALVKQFGQFQAVKGVSFKVHSGDIFGFLGPNGAGKSTTVSMLTTLSLPTAGRATVGGYDVATQAGDVRRIAGVALQEVGIDPLMKSLELLTIQGQILGLSRKAAQSRGKELLDIVKLSDPAIIDRRVGKYSGGMRRRLDLALALVHEPSVLFLDEPTTGLDPASRRDVWDEVRRLNKRLGVTIFLTTQYLEEADELADRIAIIDGGVIVAEGTPGDLKAQIGTESINVAFRELETVDEATRAVSDMATRVQADGHVLRLYMSNAAAAVPAVVSRLQNAGLDMVSLTLTQPTLDDVFLKVTGKRMAVSEDKPKPASNRWARAS